MRIIPAMAATYVYRMDDVAPGMHRARFEEYIELFREHGMRPLLGVVPDCRDPDLVYQEDAGGFWDRLRELKRQGAVDIAQHGFRHLYRTREYGILGRRYGFKPQSEFAGRSYEEQLGDIRRGKAILAREGLDTDIWMAPSHSFDRNTLKALKEAGFRFVTDGIALYPYRAEGLVFVPQQLWAPKKVQLGTWTIFIHSNLEDPGLLEQIRGHLSSTAEIVGFRVAAAAIGPRWGAPLNGLFRLAYMTHIATYNARAQWRKRP